MKNIFKLIILSFVAFFVASCSRDDSKVTVADTPSASSLSASVSTVTLLKADAAKNAITFNWTNPNYNASVAQTSQLQFAVKGTNFKVPKTVDLPAGVNSVTYTVQDFNTILLGLGLPTNASSQIEVRLISTLASMDSSAVGLPVAYSPAVVVTATPYALISFMYAPGAYQGWDPLSANTLVSANSNGIYIGYINFPAAGSEFKITADKSWATNYGSNDNKTLAANGANIVAPGAGYYKLTVDMNQKTFALTPYSMGLVGDATPNGWNGPDLQMTWNDATTSWTYTGVFAAGSLKFRTNNSWTENYGGANGVVTTDNISITAGTHTVTFNPFAMTYKIQ